MKTKIQIENKKYCSTFKYKEDSVLEICFGSQILVTMRGFEL